MTGGVMSLKKNNNAIAAFRKYARYGYDKVTVNIFDICNIALGATSGKNEAAELVAVYQTLRALEYSGRAETADAVRAVYFRYASRPLKKNEIAWRVRRFAVEGYMDERTVYRHLRVAKELFERFYVDGIKK